MKAEFRKNTVFFGLFVCSLVLSAIVVLAGQDKTAKGIVIITEPGIAEGLVSNIAWNVRHDLRVPVSVREDKAIVDLRPTTVRRMRSS